MKVVPVRLNSYSPLILALVLLFAIVPLLTPPRTAAAELRRYTTREGLAGDFVTALARAPNGDIWVGTTNGATRIAGGRWTSFTQVHGLGNRWITVLAPGPDGRIWFGTQGGGVSVFDPDSRTFKTWNVSNSDLPADFVTALALDRQGNVWVGTLASGVAYLNVAADHWTGVGPQDQTINALAFDSRDRLWAGTSDGILRYDVVNGVWQRGDLPDSTSVKRIDRIGHELVLTTTTGRYVQAGDAWAISEIDPLEPVLGSLGIPLGEITAWLVEPEGRLWGGTARGLWVGGTELPAPPSPLPVVLVHGWTVAPSDTLQDSEFRFLAQYAEQDGIGIWYARGISPHNTLFQNAAQLRDEIARVRAATGASQVNIVAFSMGGLNTRALLESSLYQGNVNRALILGTPQAGVGLWKPILAQDILALYNQPSAIELSPEYARLLNSTQQPRTALPYDLLIGDARQQAGLDYISSMPANDGLIEVSSALALDGPNVRKHINADLHAYNPEPVPFEARSYLYPADTYERYLRNALRDLTNAPIGSEVREPEPQDLTSGIAGNHTPVIAQPLRAGETVTRTVVLDHNREARFSAYYPGGAVDFLLTAPDGKRYEPEELTGAADNQVLSLQTDIASFTGYVVRDAPPGTWQLMLTRTDRGELPINIYTYVDLDADRSLSAVVSQDWYELGAQVSLTATVGSAQPGLVMQAHIAEPSPVPSQPFTVRDVLLYDDGAHGDDRAGDGIFAGQYTPPRAGWYVVLFEASAPDFTRGTETLFAVNPGGARLLRQAELELGPLLPSGARQVVVNTTVAVERAGQYAVSAALWREDATLLAQVVAPVRLMEGTQRVPVALGPLMLTPEQHTIDLVLLDRTWAAVPLDSVQGLAVQAR